MKDEGGTENQYFILYQSQEVTRLGFRPDLIGNGVTSCDLILRHHTIAIFFWQKECVTV